MIEATCRTSLGDKSNGSAFISQQIGMDDLDRDGSSECLLFCAIDTAHAAYAQQIKDYVAAR
jgi:hypothetical protein